MLSTLRFADLSKNGVLLVTAATATCLAVGTTLYLSRQATLSGSTRKSTPKTKPSRPKFLRIRAYFKWGHDSRTTCTQLDSSSSSSECNHSAASEDSASVNHDAPATSAADPRTEEWMKQPGILAGQDYYDAVNTCRERVARIVRECREDNRRFRDIEFDLEADQDLCLFDLTKKIYFAPTDVRRVTELYDTPRFFVGKSDPNDIVQGVLGDCYFLSALSAMTTMEGLVERLCVDRDEEIGVYAFVFRKNGQWVPVIIDDLLYTSVPQFESLNSVGQLLFKNNRDAFNSSARKGGEGLYFARSGKEGETWVPLIEKAYAKLHGSYEALSGGFAADALEEMTGGVSQNWETRDILDRDRWWDEELSKTGQDRFFDLSFPKPSTERSGAETAPAVDGLMGRHSYVVLKAKEVQGRRFVVLRNPWGDVQSKWKGKWADCSKEWTSETASILQELGHTLGDRGIFVMEYDDLLDNFEDIQCTKLLSPSWTMAQNWVAIPPKPDGYPWTHGEIIYYFELTKPTQVHLVLSQLEKRSFQAISGRVDFTLDFVVRKLGDRSFYAESPPPWDECRSVGCELYLEAGEYAVYPRIQRDHDGARSIGYYKASLDGWNKRKLSRVLTQRAQAMGIITSGIPDVMRHWKHYPKHYLYEPSAIDLSVAPEDSSTDTATKSGKPPKQPVCSMTELPYEVEDREALVLGLQLYMEEPGSFGYLEWEVPPEGATAFPVAAPVPEDDE